MFLSTAAFMRSPSLHDATERDVVRWPIFHENRFGRCIRQYPDVRFGPNTVHDRTSDLREYLELRPTSMRRWTTQ